MPTRGPTPFSGACPCWLRAESRPIRNHELRTPITLIAGHAEGLLRSGLSVVRLLIEAMGGRMQVVAQPGGGADFQLCCRDC